MQDKLQMCQKKLYGKIVLDPEINKIKKIKSKLIDLVNLL